MEQLHEETKTRLETTLAELIAALTEEANPYVRNDRKDYAVAAVALGHILSKGDGNPEGCGSSSEPVNYETVDEQVRTGSAVGSLLFSFWLPFKTRRPVGNPFNAKSERMIHVS